MGSRFPFLFAVPLLLATPAFAQQDNSTEPVFNLPRTPQPQRAQPEREGPELDVFRGAPAPVAPPPVVAPTIQLPPAVTPAPQPAPQSPERRPAAPPTRPLGPLPPQSEPVEPSPAQPGAPLPASPAPDQPLPPGDNAAGPAIEAAPTTPAAPLGPEEAPRWPLFAALAFGLVLLAIAFLWLRRRKGSAVEDQLYEPAPEPEAETPAPVAAPPVPDPSQPAPAVPPRPKSGDRPWLDLTMEVQAARLTLMGATIGYLLTVHNRGNRPAEDVLIRSLIANADAQQQALFQRFFAGETGMPVHSAVSIAPGETQKLTGELRLDAQEIGPIQMGDRALLIPLVAFDAQYHWIGETGDTEGTGRTGRAFIVGQEQSPPVERLSPFRLDLGPRHYRAPGSRATALALES